MMYLLFKIALEKHVNGHFTTQDQQNNKDRRSADLPAPKKVKPGFRKTRPRRQNAWSGKKN